MNSDCGEQLAQRVREAFEAGTPLRIVGANTKARLGRAVAAPELSVNHHCGIVEYMPTELVITARAGTPLADVEAVLAEQNQMLPFEPPQLGEGATLGGTLACGLSGPRRPFAGAARDLVLGMRIINGQGEILNFGGQVMKNVAGYDISRLMAGAQGTLGVLLDISLKVLPRPEAERTVVLEVNASEAIETMNRLAGQALPLSAACYDGEKLWLRLSVMEAAMDAAVNKIGGELVDGEQFWLDLKEQRLEFFATKQKWWRLSLPPAAPMLDLPGQWLLDWGGAQRWLVTDVDDETVFGAAARAGGYASCHNPQETRLPPLSAGQLSLQQRVKQAFDPKGILNSGRMYSEI
jgi:glycolate oxidase FAD binding subunit